ncbi:GDSL-type esterase/lipase family protein [Nanoarchaeota archaeon]
MKYRQNRFSKKKKAQYFGPFVTFFAAIVMLTAFVALTDKQAVFDPIGEKQQGVTKALINAEKNLLYLDEQAKFSLQDSLLEIVYKGGLKKPDCGAFVGYNKWNDFKNNEIIPCFPNALSAEKNLKEVLSAKLYQDLLESPEPYFIEDDYDFAFTQKAVMRDDDFGFSIKTMDKFIAHGFASKPIEFSDSEVSLGTIEQEIIDKIGSIREQPSSMPCNTGECVAELAEYYVDVFYDLPYVLGGESPYDYRTTSEDKNKNPKSFFKNANITRFQPSPKNTPTLAGFDSSGFVWWVLKQAGMDIPRLTADDLRKYVSSLGLSVVCEGITCEEGGLEDAQPGDLFFIEKDGISRHAGIYLGELNVAESVASAGTRSVKPIEHLKYVVSNPNTKAYVYRLEINKLKTPSKSFVPSREDISFDSSITNQEFSYTVYPSFSAEAEFDINDFSVVSEKAQKLVADVVACQAGAGDIDICVDASMAILNTQDLEYKWASGSDCDVAEENIVSPVFEALQNCIDSESFDCLCRFSFERTQQDIRQKQLEGEYLFRFNKDFSDTEITAVLREPFKDIQANAQLFDADSLIDEPLSLEIEYDEDSLDKAEIGFKRGLAATAPLLDGENFAVYKTTSSKGLQYRIGKIESDDLIFPDYGKAEKIDIKKIKDCKKPRTKRLCVKRDKKMLVTESVGNEKIKSLKPLTYKFALYFADEPPKPLNDTEVFNKDYDDNSTIIIWNKAPEADIQKYTIFVSENAFLQKPIADLRTSPLTEIKRYEISAANIITFPSHLDLTKCDFSYANKNCLYDLTSLMNTKVTLDKNKLYEFRGLGHQKLAYIVDGIGDNQQYYFAVTATDFGNNEIDNILPKQKLQFNENYVLGSSFDDLGPDLVVPTLSATEDSIAFSWNKPNNVDGSPTQSSEKLKYDILFLGCRDFDMTFADYAARIDYKDDQTITKQFADLNMFQPCFGDPKMPYYYNFVIIAKDDKDNPSLGDFETWPYQIWKVNFKIEKDSQGKEKIKAQSGSQKTIAVVEDLSKSSTIYRPGAFFGDDTTSTTSSSSTGVCAQGGSPGGNLATIGDSITVRYWRDLNVKLRDSSCSATMTGIDSDGSTNQDLGGGDNHAFVGKRTDQMLNDLPSVMETGPYHTYVILGGINDIYAGRAVSSIKENLAEIYRQIKSSGGKVVVLTVLPTEGYEYYSPAIQTKTDELNTWIKQQQGLTVDIVVDAYIIMGNPSNPEELNPAFAGSDKLHPNDPGKLKLAQEVFNAVK